MFSAVGRSGDTVAGSSRWPKRLNNIPEEIVREWVYRHYQNFEEWNQMYDIGKWTFEKGTLSNPNILKIEHLDNELNHWLKLGMDWLNPNGQHQHDSIWLREYMLQNGTFPSPIIIAIDAGYKLHTKSLKDREDYMKEPYQLIEGHKRLGFIRALIDSDKGIVVAEHSVWIMKFN